jgi:hypothetical protein
LKKTTKIALISIGAAAALTAGATAGVFALTSTIEGAIPDYSTAAPSASAQPEVEAEPTAEPVAEPIPGDEDGDGFLSEREKLVYNATSPRDYVLNDGTVVTVSPNEPLPASVVEDVKQDASPAAGASASARGDQASGQTYRDLIAALDAKAAETGRGFVALYRLESTAVGPAWTVAVSGTSEAPYAAVTSYDEALGKAQALADGRGYELITF